MPAPARCLPGISPRQAVAFFFGTFEADARHRIAPVSRLPCLSPVSARRRTLVEDGATSEKRQLRTYFASILTEIETEI